MSLKLTIKVVAFFLGHPVYGYSQATSYLMLKLCLCIIPFVIKLVDLEEITSSVKHYRFDNGYSNWYQL